MERPLPLDDPEHAVDQLLPLEVADFAQGQFTTEVIVAVGVAAGAAQRALAGDLDGKGWCVSAEDATPSRDNAFHLFTIA